MEPQQAEFLKLDRGHANKPEQLFSEVQIDRSKNPISITEIEELCAHPLFRGLSISEVLTEHARMDECVYRAGEVISCEDSIDNRFHVVIGGKVDFYISDGKGGEINVGEAGAGSFFGDVALSQEGKTGLRIKARENVKTFAFEPYEIKDFLSRHPMAAYEVLKDQAPRHAYTERVLSEIVDKNLSDELDKNVEFSERFAHAFARFVGSWKFISVQAGLILGVMAWNMFPGLPHFDPYPFFATNYGLTFLAGFTGPILLKSQNRQSERSALIAELDHELSKKNEIGISLMLKKMDDMQRQIDKLSK